MDPTIFQALLELGGTGLLGGILYLVLQQKFKSDSEEREQRAEEYKYITQILSEVIERNSTAMARVEKTLNGFPEFVSHVDQRLGQGKRRFDEHDERLRELEDALRQDA